MARDVDVVMDVREARKMLASTLAVVERLSYADLLARAPTFKGRRRLLGLILSEDFEPVDGSYEHAVRVAPSGVAYNVTTEVFWSDYSTRVLRVIVCVDDGGEHARRPLCESIEVSPPAR